MLLAGTGKISPKATELYLFHPEKGYKYVLLCIDRFAADGKVGKSGGR